MAGAALEAAEKGTIKLNATVRFRKADIPGFSPVMEAKLQGSSGTATLSEAVDAALVHSDNMAANLLINALAGPRGVTTRWRGWGDRITRLDRREIELNSNRKGDPRDSSTPRAMTLTTRLLIDGRRLSQAHADRLARLMHRSPRGLDRVRAGLPKGWSAGSKIGTCAGPGQANGQYNDIGWFRAGPGGPLYWYSVMLDRPRGSPADAAAIHARLGQIFAAKASR